MEEFEEEFEEEEEEEEEKEKEEKEEEGAMAAGRALESLGRLLRPTPPARPGGAWRKPAVSARRAAELRKEVLAAGGRRGSRVGSSRSALRFSAAASRNFSLREGARDRPRRGTGA